MLSFEVIAGLGVLLGFLTYAMVRSRRPEGLPASLRPSDDARGGGH
jgi:hypothetical protein